MKKNFRWLTALAVVGTVIGLVIAYICRKNREAMDEDVFEDEDDFALDSDLKPVSEREYVPLNKTEKKEPESEKTDSKNSEEADADEEEVQDKTEDGTDEDQLSEKE